LPRVLPAGTNARVDSSKWEIPPLFRWLQEKAGLSQEQLLSTFNCGVGMIAVCSAGDAAELAKKMGTGGVRCWPIGLVEKNSSGGAPTVVWG
jgi:phosphoribosylformylglycinamidine cyclo-ligase